MAGIKGMKRPHREYGTYHPLYWRWQSMKQRCYYPKHNRYHLYGGRGIKVCDRWLNFEMFARDMMPMFKPDLSLDRIDNNGNYEPGNCRWATIKEQARNTSQNIRHEHSGEKLTLGQWAERVGIKRKTLSQRIHGYGWSLGEALTTPVTGKRG